MKRNQNHQAAALTKGNICADRTDRNAGPTVGPGRIADMAWVTRTAQKDKVLNNARPASNLTEEPGNDKQMPTRYDTRADPQEIKASRASREVECQPSGERGSETLTKEPNWRGRQITRGNAELANGSNKTVKDATQRITRQARIDTPWAITNSVTRPVRKNPRGKPKETSCPQDVKRPLEAIIM
ncbi:hypothetical protein R1flu_019607 [Riccia fluitans]|uniref:Uncharacterized protein n=1 Tax=Riccia fluitans TaxID=41844 RepID=A0ABD1ZJ50_9MARC